MPEPIDLCGVELTSEPVRVVLSRRGVLAFPMALRASGLARKHSNHADAVMVKVDGSKYFTIKASA